MTQRIEPFSKYCSKNWTLVNIWLEELNPFSKYYSLNPCQHMTRRIEPQNITHRIEPFSTYDSKNWTFFSKELFQYDSKDEIFQCFEQLNPFLIWPKELTFLENESNIWTLFEHDSKNWTFFHMTSRTQLFSKLAHRIEFFEVILSIVFFFEKKLKELKELNPSCKSLKWLNFFFCWKYDSKNLNFFFNLTQRIAPTFFFSWFKYLDLFTWLKELNLLFHVTQILQLFQRNGPFFFGLKVFSSKKKKNSQNWFFFESDPQNWFFCDLNRLISWIWRKELKRLISWIWRKDLNHFFKITLKELVFFTRLKELNFFMNMT